jgi:hypothetical protein
VAGFALKQYRKDYKKKPEALQLSNFRKKIEKCFNCDKKRYFIKKCRSLKINKAEPREARRKPIIRINTAESNRHEYLL